jgi:hypothetical protein
MDTSFVWLSCRKVFLVDVIVSFVQTDSSGGQDGISTLYRGVDKFFKTHQFLASSSVF